MISINKLPKPKILVENEDKWTQEYLDELDAGNTPNNEISTRYNHPEIKKRLEEETHGKCAYCESKFKHISYGDIEHILTKNKEARPDLYVEWNNLTLACEQCNRSGKRSYYNENLLLINPYKDDVENHFNDIGEFIYPALKDERAEITLITLNLNRSDLIERRQERIRQIEVLLKSWGNQQNEIIKKELERQICIEYEADKEYSSTVKAFLLARGFPISPSHS